MAVEYQIAPADLQQIHNTFSETEIFKACLLGVWALVDAMHIETTRILQNIPLIV